MSSFVRRMERGNARRAVGSATTAGSKWGLVNPKLELFGNPERPSRGRRRKTKKRIFNGGRF